MDKLKDVNELIEVLLLFTCYILFYYISTNKFTQILYPFYIAKDLLYALEMKAVAHLSIPSWSRRYLSCQSEKNEINCSQLILAYFSVLQWERKADLKYLQNNPLKVVHIEPKAGIGNALYHILSGVIFAMAHNRVVHVKGHLEGINYAKSMNFDTTFDFHCNNYTHVELRAYEYWDSVDSKTLDNYPIHLLATYCYPYFMFFDDPLSKFVFSHFGLHFLYYLSNYATRIRNDIHKNVVTLFEAIPSTTKVIGVHLRHHDDDFNIFFSKKEMLDVGIVPFLREYMKDRNYVALATDSESFVCYLREKLTSNQIITAAVQRKADGDKESAATDIELLMMCNQMIGTFRSSFSAIAAQRSMIRPYYAYPDGPYLFRFSSSQMGITSMIYENINIINYNYMTNFKAKIRDMNENSARDFFRNLGL